MAQPRVVLLSVLDGRGRFGLGPETAAAVAAGADVVPIATGVIESTGDQSNVRTVRPRLVAAALAEALREPADGMLIGLLPDYWQARAVHRALLENLPETLVWAPLPGMIDGAAFLGNYNRRLQITQLLPEATVAVLPERGAGDLLGKAGADRASVAAMAVEAGAHAAWVRSTRDDGRSIDTLQVGSQASMLDYPRRAPGAPPVAAAILAALLAAGRDLGEAVEAACRCDARLGDITRVAVRA